MDLDKAIRDFKAYCEGNGNFDELDLKEVIYQVVDEARLKEHQLLNKPVQVTKQEYIDLANEVREIEDNG